MSIEEHVGLSDLLDQDLSSYEYFHSLTKELQDKIIMKDITSFEDMQEYVSQQRKYHIICIFLQNNMYDVNCK